MSLQESIRTDTIDSLAMRPLLTVEPDAPVRHAVAIMKRHGQGVVMIVDDDGRPVGMFNEKILIRVLAGSPNGLDEPVAQHMTTRVVTIRATDTIAALISTMQSQNLRWVCVVDEADKAIAITGLRGFVEYFAEYLPRIVRVQPIRTHRLDMKQREGA